MFLKKITILFITLLFSINVLANDMEIDIIDPTDKCESEYAICLDTCEAADDRETCFDKCDNQYDKCLTKAQSN